jgi:hypothetical protein
MNDKNPPDLLASYEEMHEQEPEDWHGLSNRQIAWVGVFLMFLGCAMPIFLLLIAIWETKIGQYIPWLLLLHGCWVGPFSVFLIIASIVCWYASRQKEPKFPNVLREPPDGNGTEPPCES